MIRKSDDRSRRYVFHTRGVCSPEIHFRLAEGRIRDVRFMGGGCPGNAQFAARLMEGRPAREILDLAGEIVCRNETSCPDQLALGIASALKGDLEPVFSFKIRRDSRPRSRIALMGEPGGRIQVLEEALHSIKRHRVESILCLGNLCGNSCGEDFVAALEKEDLFPILGERDWANYSGKEGQEFSPSLSKKGAQLSRVPHALSFHMAGKTGFAFYGKYLQGLEGYSDFEPFALEINLVCDLMDFMENTDALDALKSMIPQFSAQIIVFGQKGRWGFWEIDGVSFVGVGPAVDEKGLAWGLLEAQDSSVSFRVIREP